MIDALAAELFKLRTTRTFLALTLSVVGIVTLICGLIAALGDFGPGDEPVEDILSLAFFVWPFAYVVGALAVSTEFRHGTVTPSLLAVPNRMTLLGAKLAAHLAAGFLLGLVAYLVPTLVMLLVYAIRDIPPELSGGEFSEVVVGSAVVAALYAGIGVGVGAIVRNQVLAVIGGLAWLTVLEVLVSVIPGMDILDTWGLRSLASAVSGIDFGFDDTLAAVPAALVLALYAAVFAGGGAYLMRRRDIESKT